MSAVPVVSVGLPVRNGERYVAGAIASILAQDFGDLELVISDNASTDGTRDICEEFARQDRRVRYERATKDRGAAWNFSRLPHLARGRLFHWAAHDDEWQSPSLGACVAVLDSRPDVSLVFPQTQNIDEHGKETDLEPVTGFAAQDRPAARARSVLLNPAFPAAAPFGLVRRDQFLRTDLLRPYKGSDRVLLVQLALMGKVHEIPEPWFIHRRHPARSAGLTKDQWKTWWDGGPTGRRIYPRSRLLYGYASAVVRADVSPATRAEIFAGLPLWIARNASPLAQEAAGAVVAHTPRPRRA